MDVISSILEEAETYRSMEDLEAFGEGGADLPKLPLQPLYLALRGLEPVDCAVYLGRLSVGQRQALLDIDIWKKDGFDIERFHFWPQAYRDTDSDIRLEFAKSESFALFLKGKMNIWTFDVEDPRYPDHDNYFLTEDNLLLFEYEDDYPYVDEIRVFIKDLYTNWGVEEAYSYLFKIVSDTYSNMSEEEYKLKNDRLAEHGFIDYYDALELLSPMLNRQFVDRDIAKKKSLSGFETSLFGLSLHRSCVTAFQGRLKSLQEEVGKVEDKKRQDFLRFDFVRLVNGMFVLDGSLKEGSIAMGRSGRKVCSCLLLGFDYISHRAETRKLGSLFEHFDFRDCYRYGLTLVDSVQKSIKKSLLNTNIKGNEKFLGSYWVEFLRRSLDTPPKVCFGSSEQEVSSVDAYTKWIHHAATFIGTIPFADRFAHRLFELRKKGLLSDDFYLNYNVDDIDFEALILSSFANFLLGSSTSKKMGLTLSEFKTFSSLVLADDCKGKVNAFVKTFGFDAVPSFGGYVETLIREHLEGYEHTKMEDDEYRYLGGPIILRY